MKHTKHSLIQQQRRGIEAGSVDLALEFGLEHKATNHGRMYRVPKRELRFLKADCPEPLWRRYRDSLNRIVPVVAGDDQVLTAMHRFRRIRRFK
jgi:hypothetical protein